MSGILTASPLAMREAQAAIGLPVLNPDTLRDAGSADLLGITQNTKGILRCSTLYANGSDSCA